MANIDQTRLREALLARNLCDAQTAVSIGEVCQDVWQDATRDLASEDKIALAIADLRASLLEAIHENERVFSAQLLEIRRETDVFRREQAERDERFLREMAERDDRRDTRSRWLIGLSFTAFGALASVLAVFT